MSELNPTLWSDFDGTAVKLAKKTNPRNWSKYPMRPISGYADFLEGVRSTGVEIGGVITRRPDIRVRRAATARSIAKLGYSQYFTNPDKVVHAGSERAKGRFLAEQSHLATVGMLEDKPHRLGAILLGVMQDSVHFPDGPASNIDADHPIVLGVVAQPRRQEYLEELVFQVSTSNNVELHMTEIDNGLQLQSKASTLYVINLEPYSVQAGQSFGQQILDVAV